MAEETTTLTEATPPSEHGKGFPPFQPNTFGSQLLWLAIFFGALYLLASKVMLPRVGSILEDRQRRIGGDLADAARMKGEADLAIAAYEKSLADARARAQAIAAETRDRLHAQSEGNRKALEHELNAKLATADRSIATTRSGAMTNVRSIAEELASAIVERLTGTVPTRSEVESAVAETVGR
jgi:F-type H+-transporting ATPase subunit b